MFNQNIYVADFEPLNEAFEHETWKQFLHDFPKMRGRRVKGHSELFRKMIRLVVATRPYYILKMILIANVFIIIYIFDTLIVRKNIDRRWQDKIPMRLSLRSISCENTIQLRNTKEFFAPIRYKARSYISKQAFMDFYMEKNMLQKLDEKPRGEYKILFMMTSCIN